MIEAERKAKLQRRLQAIEGQVRGLQRMTEEERPCVEILTQIASVQEALRGVSKLTMRNYLETCATNAIRAADSEAIYDEMMDVIFKYVR